MVDEETVYESLFVRPTRAGQFQGNAPVTHALPTASSHATRLSTSTWLATKLQSCMASVPALNSAPPRAPPPLLPFPPAVLLLKSHRVASAAAPQCTNTAPPLPSALLCWNVHCSIVAWRLTWNSNSRRRRRRRSRQQTLGSWDDG